MMKGVQVMTQTVNFLHEFPTFWEFFKRYGLDDDTSLEVRDIMGLYPHAFYKDFKTSTNGSGNALHLMKNENKFSMGWLQFYDMLCNMTTGIIWYKKGWLSLSQVNDLSMFENASNSTIISQRLFNDCGDIFASFDKMCEAFQKEYEMIENYRMIENRSKENNTAGGQLGNIVSPAGYVNYENDAQLENDIKSNANQRTKTNYNETGSESEELTRSGNIGVTTSQQMLESEIELRKKFNEICVQFINDIEKRIMTFEVLPL